MTAGYVIFLVVGRLLIYIANKFAKDNDIKIKFLNNLLSCSLCAGVWAYAILSGIMRYSVFADTFPYIPVISEVITGCFSSYLVYLVENGYRSLYEVIVV